MGTTATPRPVKDRFRNDGGGIVGAVIEAPGGGYKGVPVYPGETIDLDDVEQAMTANAPRSPADNPLANGQLVVLSEGLDFKERRPMRTDPALAAARTGQPVPGEPDAGYLSEETATVVQTDGPAPVGQFAQGEETGAPAPEEITSREAARKPPPPAPPRPAPRPK